MYYIFVLHKPPYAQSILIPLIQSAVSGCLAYLTARTLATIASSQDPAHVGAAWGLTAAVITWSIFTARYQLLIEKHHPSRKPEEQPKRMTVHLASEDRKEGKYLKLNLRDDQIKALGDGLSHGQPFTVAAWSGPGKPFTRAEFETVRQELIDRGILYWRNRDAPGQGVELSRAGLTVMNHFSQTTPPLPHIVSKTIH